MLEKKIIYFLVALSKLSSNNLKKISFFWSDRDNGLVNVLAPPSKKNCTSGKSNIKRHCQQDPQEMETGGSADHDGTIFFGFLVQN